MTIIYMDLNVDMKMYAMINMNKVGMDKNGMKKDGMDKGMELSDISGAVGVRVIGYGR